MTEKNEQISMEQASEKLSKKSTVEDFRNAIESIRNEYFSKWEMSHIGTRAMARLLFLKQVAEILILLTKRYPDFFWKTKIAQWHTDDSPVSSREISTILDIIKYGTAEQKRYFMKMMESSKNGNTEDAVELYENYFSWTSISQAILWHFKDSPLMFSLDERILKTVDRNKWTEEVKKGSILDIIKNHPQWKRIATGTLSNIPQKHLDTFFFLLPEIEECCYQGDLEALKRKINTHTDIDVVHKDQFFTALKLLSPLSIDMNKSFKEKATKNMEFYTQMEKYFWEQIGVKKEREDLLENKDTSSHFTIINDSFPYVEREILQEKNWRLERLLSNFIDKDGKIIVESGNFKRELLEIFRGSEIGNKLEKGTMNPKEMLNYLLTASKQQKEHTKKQLAISDPSFSSKNLDQLRREKPEEYTKLLSLLNGTESTDKKMRALRSYSITTNDLMQQEGQEQYIKNILQSIKYANTEKHLASILADDKKLALFEQYWNGGSLEVFNKAIEKRDQEVQQAELKQKALSKQDEKTNDRAYEFSQIDFSKTPFHEIIPTKIGDITFGIRKDTEDTSTVLYKWMEISGVETKSLDQVPEMVQFIGNTGLDIFGPHISRILTIINNRQTKKGGEEQINLKNGLWSNEKHIILKSIADIIISGAGNSNNEKLEENFKNIHRNGGMLEYLRQNKKEYIGTDNSLNINAFINSLERAI